MKLRKNVAISESGLLFNPVTGESFSLNPLGVEILNMIREEMNPDQISNAIIERYSTDRTTFAKDFYDFISILEHHNLLERDEETKA